VRYFKYKENQQEMNGGMIIVEKQFERRITPEVKRSSPKQGQVKKATEKKGRWQIRCVEIKRKSGSMIKACEWRKIERKMKRGNFLKALKTPDNKDLIQQYQ
jgi:hypothetical protein